jgi:xylulokinase
VTVLFGIDVGTSATKGLAITPDGEVLATEEAAYPLSTPKPGWSEQNPEDWWRATREVLENLERTAGPPTGIGLSGQMHGLVALDSNDDVIRPAILWNDQRTQAECDEIERTIGLQRLIELTGNRALTGFTAPKILWLRRNEPDNYKRIASVLLPKDYVRLRLTGEHATDVSDASGTLLLDVANRSWSQEVLTALKLDPAWLPAALESPELSGQTTKTGTPVAAGAGDQAAGAVGVGVDHRGPVSVAVGTSGVVFATLDAFAADDQARIHAFCHAVPDKWHAMGVMLSAAGSLAWLRNATDPDTPFDTLLKEADQWPPGAEGLIFLPYLAGERTPHADPDARGAFVGLSLRHDRGALTRAVLEGVAFALKDSLDLTEELGGTPKTGRISGGGARSALWTQIIASVLQIPLEPVAVDEGAAFGAAILGGVAAGVWPDVHTAVQATVKPRAQIEPVPDWIEPYREQRDRFRALYPALKAVR